MLNEEKAVKIAGNSGFSHPSPRLPLKPGDESSLPAGAGRILPASGGPRDTFRPHAPPALLALSERSESQGAQRSAVALRVPQGAPAQGRRVERVSP